MTRKVLFFTTLLSLTVGSIAVAQQPASGMTTTSQTGLVSPKDKWEVGVNVGTMFSVGDVAFKPGFGGGLHLRKSLDHVFSLRGQANFGKFKGDDGGTAARNYSATYAAATGQAVITLNNLRFNKPTRKVNLYVFGGVGLNYFKTDYNNIFDFPSQDPAKKPNGTYDGGINGNMDVGAGLTIRINPKMNFAIEHTANIGFGSAADFIDGDANNNYELTSYRDVVHYFHVGLNFNIGKADRSEPLYWINPANQINNDIAELKARPVYDPTDTDGDGIIDAIDQEKESPAGARVDTRGVTLDSDSDGLADYKDKEPYSPPGYKVDGMGIAQIPKEPKITEADVNRIVDGKLKDFKVPQQGIIDWFLPMIHFDLDRYDIKRNEYENLYQIAQVMKQNPTIKVVVAGHTDRSSGNTYNNVLSYNRAKASIEFLVATHGISRDRLLLNWGGEDTTLVPSNGQNYINRRAEFRVATATDKEQGRPEGPKAGKGKFKGNIDAGF